MSEPGLLPDQMTNKIVKVPGSPAAGVIGAVLIRTLGKAD